jgi:hypothetical protein
LRTISPARRIVGDDAPVKKITVKVTTTASDVHSIWP